MSRGQAAPRSAAAAQDVRTHPQPSPSPSSSSMSKTPTLPTTTHTTNVTLLEVVNVTDASSIGSNVSAGTTPTSTGGVASLNRSVWAVSAAGSSTEDYTRQKAEFYQSYDPEIGLHTAAVLGGILGWLIIYLLYKTKVKKCVLGFLRKRYKKRKQKRREQKKRKKKQLEAFAEVPDHDLGSDPSAPVKNTHPDSEGSGGSGQQPPGDSNPCPQQQSEEGFPGEVTCTPAPPPMPSIVVESCSSLPNSRPRLNSQGVEKHCDPDSPRRKSPKGKAVPGRGSEGKVTGRRGSEGKVATAASGKGGEQKKKKYRRRSKGRGQGRECPEVTMLDVDGPETTTLLLPPPPPSSQADAAQATARWVQTMPLLRQSHQDVTGLLLKIRPSLLGSKKQQSCPLISAALQYAALPLLGLPHLGLNNSMPHLADNGMGSLKNSRDLLFEDDDQQDLERNKDVQLLQPLPYSAPPASRPQSSQSHVGGSSSLPPPPPPPPPRTPLVPARTPPIPSRVPPPPRLTISIPGSVTPSGSTLVVPGGAGWMTSSCSAPTSPVPLPVTPTVTIQNCTPRVGGRGRGRVGGGESEDSGSSSSSLDPLLTLQADCHCPSRPPPPSPTPSPSPSHYHLPPSPFPRPSHSPLPPSPLARPPPSPLPPPSPSPSPSAVAKTPQSSWTVFDDDDDRGRCGSGGGGGEREGGEGSGASSRQNCLLRFTFPPTPGPGFDGEAPQGRSGPQDVGITLETKL